MVFWNDNIETNTFTLYDLWFIKGECTKIMGKEHHIITKFTEWRKDGWIRRAVSFVSDTNKIVFKELMLKVQQFNKNPFKALHTYHFLSGQGQKKNYVCSLLPKKICIAKKSFHFWAFCFTEYFLTDRRLTISFLLVLQNSVFITL